MSDKDDKRLMQCLLIACAFVLVLLYLYFTKGACWEMNEYKDIVKELLITAFLLPLVCIGIIGGIAIWNCDKTNNDKNIISMYCCHFSDDTKKSCCCNAKKCSVKIDGDESFIYIAEKNIEIPDGIKNVVVQKLEVLKGNGSAKKLENVYVVCPSDEVSEKEISEFGFTNAKIHFNTNGKIFTMKINNNNNKQITTLSTDCGDSNQNNSEVGNAPEQHANEDTKIEQNEKP